VLAPMRRSSSGSFFHTAIRDNCALAASSSKRPQMTRTCSDMPSSIRGWERIRICAFSLTSQRAIQLRSAHPGDVKPRARRKVSCRLIGLAGAHAGPARLYLRPVQMTRSAAPRQGAACLASQVARQVLWRGLTASRSPDDWGKSPPPH
jgi:hypothetical protein